MKEMIDSTLKGADDDFINKMDDLEKIEKQEFVEPVPQFIRDFVHSILLKLADSAYHQGYHREKAKMGQSSLDEKNKFICRDAETIMLNAIKDTFETAECANDLMILTQEQFFSHIPEYMRSFVRQLACGICSCTKQVITLEKTVNAIDTSLEVNLQLKIRLERAVREKNIDELRSLSEAEYFAGLPASRSDMNVFMRFIIKLLLDSVRQTDGHIMDVSA